MKYTRSSTDHEVTLTPREPAAASVILLHGLGADGWDFVPIVEELDLSPTVPVRFVFPHAPVRPVTVNRGYEMPAWYDIRAITPEDRVDAAGLAEASRRAAGYLRREQEQGVPASRIVLAGFSQGGSVALHTGLRYGQRLAGILALSTFLPFPHTLPSERAASNADVPVLLCHGLADSIVPVLLGRETRDALSAMGYPVEWREYPIDHEVSAQELADVSRWLRARLYLG